MKNLLLSLGLAVILNSLALAAPPFRSLTLEQAQSQSGERWVVAFFTASWCGPCQVMKKNTWPRPEVADWLQQKAIAVMVDADSDKERARSLGVKHLPTTIVWRHGKEMERRVGACTADEMIGWLQLLDQGQSRLVQLSQNGPSARLEYIEALIENRRRPEAFEVLKQVWRAHLEGNTPGLLALQLTAPVQDLVAELSVAEQFFRTEHASLRQRLLDQERCPAELWTAWLELSETLKLEKEVVSLFEVLERKGQLQRIAGVRLRFYHLLLRQNLWSKAGTIVAPEVTARHFLTNRQEMIQAASELRPDNPEAIEKLARSSALTNLSRLHKALIEAKRPEAAAQVREIWTEADGPEVVRAALAAGE